MAVDVACHLNVVVADLQEAVLPSALDELARLGYTHAVLPPIDPASIDLEALAGVFRRCGISPISLAGQGPGADISSDDPDSRARGERSLRAMVDATVALGGEQMNGVPYGLFGPAATPPTRSTFERTARLIGSVADHAHSRGVAMTFEVLNRYESALMNTAQQARAFVEASGSEHLTVHLDSFHMAIEESDMLEAIRSTVPMLGYLELGQSGRGGLDTGVVDIRGVIDAALASGYRGIIGVEAFSRSVLPEPVADMLSIWREPYSDGLALAADAIGIIRDVEAARPRSDTAGRDIPVDPS